MKILSATTDIIPESRFDLDSVLFFDIESTGLSKEYSNVYLIGCANKEGKDWKITQFLAEKISEEKELISSFLEYAGRFKKLVHFNGDNFDVPYIDHKAHKYGLEPVLGRMDNYDILKRARKAKKLLNMSRMNQKSVEEFLRIRRDDEMSGGELIPFYYEYQKTKDKRLEKYLLLHNHDDIKGMLSISPIVNYADICEGRFSLKGIEENSSNITITFDLGADIPRSFEKTGEGFLIAANDCIMQAVLDRFPAAGRYYINDYKNYYYLPDEGKVIHKDVARFVDKGHREKATKANCYLKKESVFLIQESARFEPGFIIPDYPGRSFFEAERLRESDDETIKKYVTDFINK